MPTADAPTSFDDLYGLEVGAVGPTSAEAQIAVCERVFQPFGLVHGGVYASIAEALATLGTIQGIGPGEVAMGLANSTSFLRPVRDGRLHAQAAIRHRGRTTCVWDVEVYDDSRRLCAVTRMTVAVRPGERDGAGR